MDKTTVKLLLESYRPQDASDPIFAEALREVAADPELAAWFEQMQRFDAALTSKLEAIPIPADLRNHIFLGYQGTTTARDPRRHLPWAWIGSIAAAFVLGVFCWRLIAPPERSGKALVAEAPISPLALQAISYTERMPALQFVCFDAAAVASWINEQPGTQQLGLRLPKPDKSLSMAMIGSSVVDWHGRPVVMVALQNGQRMAMLYILSPDDVPGLKDGATETIEKDNWVVQAKNTNGRVQVLTTRGGPGALDFPMPF